MRRATLVLLLLAGAQGTAQTPPPFDLLIVNGRVLDGTGNPWRAADVGVRGDRIAAVGRLRGLPAGRTIDARGRFVTPGFIDVHSHAREGLEQELNHADPLVAQGITTALLNPDGGGPTDIAALRATFSRRGVGVNVGLFVPHGSIRQQVIGMADREPTGAELAAMVALVHAGMRAGAVGLSSGLYYAPGSYAKTDEVVAMAAAAGEHGGVYSSHIRDEGDYGVGLIAAVDEVIQIADEGRLPGVVSHMKALGAASWGLSVAALIRIEAARARGVEVWADQYPYDASGTSITGALVPRWAQVGGEAALRERVLGAERGRLRDEVRANIARRGGAASLLIARFVPDPAIEGQTLAALAAVTGESPEEVALDLLARGGAGLVSFNMHERDIEEIMRRDYTMTSTDGDLVPMGVGKPHPRAYGAFPRKLRRYVRERGVLGWPAAIRSMTHLPAAVFGLRDRGQIRVGAFADLLVIDEDRVADTATYREPHQLAEGIDLVLVNGVVRRDDGRPVPALPGRILSPERR